MIDLAVAVVIGAAFGKVIDSMVHDIVMPTIFVATHAVKEAKDVAIKTADKVAEKAKDVAGTPASQPATTPSADSATTQPAAAAPPVTPPPVAAAPAPAPAPEKKDEAKVVDFSWKLYGGIDIGKFIGELLNFVIVAFAVFIMIVKLVGSVVKKASGTPKPSDPTTR